MRVLLSFFDVEVRRNFRWSSLPSSPEYPRRAEARNYLDYLADQYQQLESRLEASHDALLTFSAENEKLRKKLKKVSGLLFVLVVGSHESQCA
jgi:hypothetical protein